jgi:hypothetical protein
MVYDTMQNGKYVVTDVSEEKVSSNFRFVQKIEADML